jgi:hypothetical protein
VRPQPDSAAGLLFTGPDHPRPRENSLIKTGASYDIYGMADNSCAIRPRARVPGLLSLTAIRRTGGLLVALCLMESASAQSLHEKVDVAMDAARIGPAAPAAGDAEFLRRAALTLTGMPPTSDEAREFLNDGAPDKRAKLIAALAGSREFVRHLAVQLDVMLMERRAEQHTKAAPWRTWLEESLAASKPWDELVTEMLSNDGSDEKSRHVARWMLERQAEPNLLARDAGRLFLGRDMACAQCHDHPRVDDYAQRDYHGVYAFFGRTSLFQPDPNKPALVAESAAGEAAFSSVFTKVSGQTRPRLPDGGEVGEPVIADAEKWTVAPNDKDKNVRAIPKYSRRAKLAEALPASADFRRNIANRLWGLVMGRCLVEPPDMMHSANAPAHPAVLDLLATEMAAMKFDLRTFIRELALTKTFAQAFDPAPLPSERCAELAAKLPALEAEAEKLKEESARLGVAFTECGEDGVKTNLAAQPVIAEWTKLADASAVAANAADAANAEFKKLEEAKRTLPDVIAKLRAAAEAASAAVSTVPDDKELAAATKTFQDKMAKASADGAAAEKDLPAKQAAAETKAKEAEAARQAADAKKAGADNAQKQIAAAAQSLEDADAAKRRARLLAQQAARRLSEARALLDYASAVAATPPESEEQAMKFVASPVPLDQAQGALATATGATFCLTNLTPLPPEQLCWAMLKVTGTLDQFRRQSEKEWDEKNKPADADKADPAKLAARAAGIESLTRDKMRGHEEQFVRLFAASAGQPQNDFFATADQVLYFENAGNIRAWSGVGGGNLGERLGKLTDSKALAEELYLSILTRLPDAEEANDIAAMLDARPKEQRNAVISDAIWALLCSTEFRFRH